MNTQSSNATDIGFGNPEEMLRSNYSSAQPVPIKQRRSSRKDMITPSNNQEHKSFMKETLKNQKKMQISLIKQTNLSKRYKKCDDLSETTHSFLNDSI